MSIEAFGADLPYAGAPDEIPVARSDTSLGLLVSPHDALGTLVVRANQEPSEPTTDQLVEDGELPDVGSGPESTVVYAQPPSTIPGLFAAQLAEVMDSGVGPQEKKDLVVDNLFATIKDMVNVYASTMRERGLIPNYAVERIRIPEQPSGVRKFLGMKQSSPGYRLSPYWPVITGQDLSLMPMDPDSAIGVRPDGELIYISKTNNIITGSSCKIKEIVVGPEHLFYASSIREHHTFTHKQDEIITRLVERLKEQGVANLNRKAPNYGYETIELTAEQFRR